MSRRFGKFRWRALMANLGCCSATCWARSRTENAISGHSHPLHETVDHLFLAGFLEGDGELVAVDLHHVAVTKLLVEHAVVEREFRNRAGGFRNQFAFDDHWRALVAREAAGVAPRREWRLAFVKAAAGLS